MSTTTEVTSFKKLLRFLGRLEQAKIWYRMEHIRDETVMVWVASPGQRWEVEFFEDGHIEVERFRSADGIEDEVALESLFAAMGD